MGCTTSMINYKATDALCRRNRHATAESIFSRMADLPALAPAYRKQIALRSTASIRRHPSALWTRSYSNRTTRRHRPWSAHAGTGRHDLPAGLMPGNHFRLVAFGAFANVVVVDAADIGTADG